jgi:putative colanic acid biosynthesis acetyltransferase WcaF
VTNFEAYRYVDTIPKREKVLRQLWVLIYTLAFRPTPRGLAHRWRIFLLRLFGARIGRNCRISPTCFVWAPWNLEMGDYSALGDGVDCYTMDKVRIGSKVAVSQRTFLCTGSHDTSTLLRPLVTRPISIGDHAWIAAEVMICPGVNIGEGAVIGARSFVRRDMPAWYMCAGAECSPLRPRNVVERAADRANEDNPF